MGTFVRSAGYNGWAAAIGVQEGVALEGLVHAALAGDRPVPPAEDAVAEHTSAPLPLPPDITMLAPGVFRRRTPTTIYELSAATGGPNAAGVRAMKDDGAPPPSRARSDGNDPPAAAAPPSLRLAPWFGKRAELRTAAKMFLALARDTYGRETVTFEAWQRGLAILVQGEASYDRAHLYVHSSQALRECDAFVARRIEAERRAHEEAGLPPLSPEEEAVVRRNAQADVQQTIPGRLWADHARVRRLIELFLSGSEADHKAMAEGNIDTATGGLYPHHLQQTGFHNETTQNHFQEIFDVRWSGNPYRECSARVAARAPIIQRLLATAEWVIAESWSIREEILRQTGFQPIPLQRAPGPFGGFTPEVQAALRQRRIDYLAEEARRAERLLQMLAQMQLVYEAMILLTKEILALLPKRR